MSSRVYVVNIPMHPIEIDSVIKSLSTTYNEYFFFFTEFKHKDKKGRLPIHYLVEQDSSFDDFKELVCLLNSRKDLEKRLEVYEIRLKSLSYH